MSKSPWFNDDQNSDPNCGHGSDEDFRKVQGDKIKAQAADIARLQVGPLAVACVRQQKEIDRLRLGMEELKTAAEKWRVQAMTLAEIQYTSFLQIHEKATVEQ